MRNQSVLIVDDLPEMAGLLRYHLLEQGYDVETASTGSQALDVLHGGFGGVVILDLRLPDFDGLDLFRQVRQIEAANPVIIVTAHATFDLVADAIREGAFDFISKNDNIIERLFVATKNAFATRELHSRVQKLSSELADRSAWSSVISASPSMLDALRKLEQVADTKVTVLLLGESGTGKEIVAQGIHTHSSRRDGPFVAINCAGIPTSLLESELFGHEKGAFTGATGRKIGKFEVAHNGTIFLDEIGEMDQLLQAKLLRVLQEKEFERVGGTENVQVDVRILSATNRDLAAEVKKGNFREDLYYRLNVFSVVLSPLREREGDVPLLVQHFLDRFAENEGRPVPAISDPALGALARYSFPGNVRELENIISHACVVCQHDTIRPQDLPESVHSGVLSEPLDSSAAPVPTGLQVDSLFRRPADLPRMEDMELALIERAVELCGGNVSEAARQLGIARTTIYRRLPGLKKVSR